MNSFEYNYKLGYKGTRVENQFLKKDLSEKLNAVIAENKVIKAENQSTNSSSQNLNPACTMLH